MTTEEWIRLVISFLGGGLIAGLLNWFRSITAERVNRRVDFLTEQLQSLYGPLYFFATQNERIGELGSAMSEAYEVEYCEPKWSNDEATRKSLKEETTKAIDIRNRYTEVTIENNDRMVDILVNNYSLIEPEDADLFQQFVIDVLRNRIETDDDQKLETPLRIYEHVGGIAFYRARFVDRIKERFAEKTSELDRWRRVGRLRLPWSRAKPNAT